MTLNSKDTVVIEKELKAALEELQLIADICVGIDIVTTQDEAIKRISDITNKYISIHKKV